MPHIRTRSRRPVLFAMEQLEERDVPAIGIGTFNAATDTFVLRNTATPGTADIRFQFNAPGSKAVIGDWNGDGTDDFGVFDTATATWSLKYAAETGPANAGTFQFGTPGSKAVVGDWNG